MWLIWSINSDIYNMDSSLKMFTDQDFACPTQVQLANILADFDFLTATIFIDSD